MSGQGVLRGASASPSQRMVTGSGGFFNHPAIQQLGNLATSGNGSLPFRPLDDLALESVKRQLSATKRIFLSPLSGRFASIGVPNRRLSLLINGCTVTIQNKKGASIAEYHDLDAQQLTRLVQFILGSFDKFQLVAITPGRERKQDWAAVSAVSKAELIMATSPSVRHLKLASLRWAPDWLLAIGHCHQLRSLDFHRLNDDSRSTRGLMDVVGTLPRLTSFRSITFTGHRMYRPPLPSLPVRRTLTLESGLWLAHVPGGHLSAGSDDWAFKTFLQRIANVTLFMENLRLMDTELAAIGYVISSMNHHPSSASSLPHLVIEETHGWCDRPSKPIRTRVLVDWLRLTGNHPVNVVLKCSPPLPTSKQIAKGVARSTSLGLIPSEHDRQEGEPTFYFGNGSEFRLRSL